MASPQLSVTTVLYDSVTEAQYNTLLGLIQGLLNQYAPLIKSVTQNNIPPNLIQIPVLVKVSGTDIVSAQTLVQSKLDAAFGTPPTSPVTEVDVNPAL